MSIGGVISPGCALWPDHMGWWGQSVKVRRSSACRGNEWGSWGVGMGMDTSSELHIGTGAYEGAVWDGKRWIRGGEVVRIGPWQKTTLPGKVFLLAVAAAVCGSVGWAITTVMI